MNKKQITFNLPKINRSATRDAVEQTFEKYRIMLLTEPEERLPKVTQSFSLTPPSNTNEFHSDTEEAAVINVDNIRYRRDFLKRIQKAVNRLNYQERAILIQRYMLQDNVFDYEIYRELGISDRTYYRVKSRAFYKLAFILKIEVYEEKEAISS